MNGKLTENIKSTIVIDYFSKTILLGDGTAVHCFIYDTGGQEHFRAMNKMYYKKAKAILLVYDITDIKSFESIQNYYSQAITEICPKNIPIMLLGNKLDRENERKVSQQEGIELAQSNNYLFKETSCKTNENVIDAFEALIEMWNIEEKDKILNRSYINDKYGKNKFKEDEIQMLRRTEIKHSNDLLERHYKLLYNDDKFTIKPEKEIIINKKKKKCC